jgi:hypothetical protein
MGSVVRSELQAVCRNAMHMKNAPKIKSEKKGRGELRPEFGSKSVVVELTA